MRKFIALLLCMSLTFALLTGCGKENDGKYTETEGGADLSTVSTQPLSEDVSQNDSGMFTERDCESDYDESTAIKIELNETSVNSDSASVRVSETTVTITEEATYVISGTLKDGMIIVEAPEKAKLQLVLDGVNITSSTSAALYIKEADKVFVTLQGENTLTNGGGFNAIDDNNIDAAVFSKQDLTFNGSGSLTVSSPAGHGIICKDDLVFTGGTYTVTSACHAVEANDSVRIKNTVISADAGKDGIHAENTESSEKGFVYIESGSVKIESEGDGISAGSYMQILDGTINILAGGGYENGKKESSDNWGDFGGGGGMHPGEMPPDGMHDRGGMPDNSFDVGTQAAFTDSESDSSTSMKGLKSQGSMLIEGGSFTIDSADDSVHSDMSVNVNGGTFEISSGDDAVHAEDTLTVVSGKINIANSYEGLEALHIYIQGGDIKLVATDDGLNAAGGADQSGMGGRDKMFGGAAESNSSGSIVISGGTVYIKASGDGIDANGTLEITGGYTTVVGPTQGDTATLDYDVSGTISGGTFIGTGASNMAQTFSSSEQGVIALSVGNQTAGTKITLKDNSGNEIISHTPELPYQIVILSSPDIKSDETYTVTVGTQTGEYTAN